MCSGGLQACKILRISHSLDNRLTHGSIFVRPKHQPRRALLPRNVIFLLLLLISVTG
jgi:hypothetical protein